MVPSLETGLLPRPRSTHARPPSPGRGAGRTRRDRFPWHSVVTRAVCKAPRSSPDMAGASAPLDHCPPRSRHIATDAPPEAAFKCRCRARRTMRRPCDACRSAGGIAERRSVSARHPIVRYSAAALLAHVQADEESRTSRPCLVTRVSAHRTGAASARPRGEQQRAHRRHAAEADDREQCCHRDVWRQDDPRERPNRSAHGVTAMRWRMAVAVR